MVNSEILKREIRTADVRMWQVANKLGTTPEYFSRKMRLDVSDEYAQKVRNALQAIINEQAG